jgi:hypothetical protein
MPNRMEDDRPEGEHLQGLKAVAQFFAKCRPRRRVHSLAGCQNGGRDIGKGVIGKH